MVEAPMLQFSSRAEAQEALERLRMGYIAGEVNREDYYNQKSAIERALGTFAVGTQPGEGPPRTLSISTE
jgi:hypothetical protein